MGLKVPSPHLEWLEETAKYLCERRYDNNSGGRSLHVLQLQKKVGWERIASVLLRVVHPRALLPCICGVVE